MRSVLAQGALCLCCCSKSTPYLLSTLVLSVKRLISRLPKMNALMRDADSHRSTGALLTRPSVLAVDGC